MKHPSDDVEAVFDRLERAVVLRPRSARSGEVRGRGHLTKAMESDHPMLADPVPEPAIPAMPAMPETAAVERLVVPASPEPSHDERRQVRPLLVAAGLAAAAFVWRRARAR